MTYHIEQELTSMGECLQKPDVGKPSSLTILTMQQAFHDADEAGLTLEQCWKAAYDAASTNNPESLSVTLPKGDDTSDAQISSMGLHAAPEDAQDGGGYTREELVEIAEVSMRAMLNGGAWTWATMASHAVNALIACGALKVRVNDSN